MRNNSLDTPMPETRVSLLALARDTVSDPKDGARRVLALAPEEGVLWQALVLVVALSALLTQLGELLVPTPVDPLLPVFTANPLLAAVIQGGLLVVTIYAIHFIGRAVGGSGSFRGAMALVVWLQFIMICLQVVQTVALIVLPPFAGLIGLFGIGLFFWLLSHFVAALHGFPSVGRTFVGILMSMIAIVFGMSIIMSILGFTFSGVPTDV